MGIELPAVLTGNRDPSIRHVIPNRIGGLSAQDNRIARAVGASLSADQIEGVNHYVSKRLVGTFSPARKIFLLPLELTEMMTQFRTEDVEPRSLRVLDKFQLKRTEQCAF